MLGKNLGDPIDIATGHFIVGNPVVAYEKFSEKYTLITDTIIPTTDSIVPVIGMPFPLSGINYNWGWNLVTASNSQSGVQIEPYYIFYEYKEYRPGDAVDNIIDFNNELTTIKRTNSGYSDWTKFGGIMDRILSRSFYTGLEMINE